jgi:hypothetical protein
MINGWTTLVLLHYDFKNSRILLMHYICKTKKLGNNKHDTVH